MFNLFNIINFTSFCVYNFIITPPYYIAKYFYNKWFCDSYYPLDIFYIENIFQQLNFEYEKHEDSYPLIEGGFIISNHRSFFDFFWDCYIFKTAMVGRLLAFVSIGFSSIVSYLSNKMIIMIRGVDTRYTVFNKIITFLESNKNYTNNYYKNLNVLFYPESTRMSHLKVSNDCHYLKPGLLKSIWEYSHSIQSLTETLKFGKVQICISTNKENVINEKKFFINNVSRESPTLVKYYIDKEIYPSDFETFDDFYKYIIERWCISWDKAYSNN